MTDIDWSKAPEGYSVWIDVLDPKQKEAGGWHRERSDRYADQDGRYWSKVYEGQLFTVRRKPWTGGWLPPVGTVCELNGHVHHELRKQPFEWVECTVIAHTDFGGEPIAVAKTVDGSIGWGMPIKFRPIRTPEQIAEEERKAAIEEMYRIYAEQPVATQNVRDCLAAIYDSGWRRTNGS